MAGAVLNQVNLSQFVTVEATGVHTKPKSSLDVAVELTTKASDVSRVVKFFKCGSDAVVQMQKSYGEPSPTIEGAAKTLGTIYAGLGVARLPLVTRNGLDVMAGGGSAQSAREGFAKLRDLTECVATWLYAGVLFTGAKVLDAANVLSFVADSASLPLDAGDLKLAHEVVRQSDIDKLTPDLQSKILDTRTLALVKMVKTAASVVTGAVGVFAALLGLTLLSAPAVVGVSLVGAGFGVYSSYFEKTRTQERPLINLDQLRSATALRQHTVV